MIVGKPIPFYFTHKPPVVIARLFSITLFATSNQADMNTQTFHFLPDVHGTLLLAGSWCPVLLIAFSYDRIALMLSMIVAVLAIIEYCLKIGARLSHNACRGTRSFMLTDEEARWIEERRRYDTSHPNFDTPNP